LTSPGQPSNAAAHRTTNHGETNVMPFLNFKAVDDDRAKHFVAERDDGRTARLFIPKSLAASKTFASHVASIEASANFINAHGNKIMPTMSALGWKEAAPTQLKIIGRNVVQLRDKTIETQTGLSKEEKGWLTPSKPIDKTLAAEIRNYIRARKTTEVMDLAVNNIDVANAILDCPWLSNVPSDLCERLKSVVIESNLTEFFAGIHAKKPSASEILANGPDYDVARSFARQRIHDHQYAKTEVDDAEMLLKSAIDWAAIVADVSQPMAYQLLTAA
jgi:hypothetical protein